MAQQPGPNDLIPDPQRPGQRVRRRTLKNRRRRQRQRARAQGRIAAVRPPPRRFRRVQYEEKEEFKIDAEEVLSNLSPELRTYANCVVDPFGSASIGALKPDQWNTQSIPVTDRVTVDVDPSLFFNANTPLVTMEGIFAAVVPRCFAAGWALANDPDTANDQYVPLINTDADFNAYNPVSNYLDAAIVTPVFADQYMLLIGAIGTTATSATNVFGYYSIDGTMRESSVNRSATGTPMSALNCIRFARFAKYNDNTDGGRILGMGLKATSEAAPINTGGTTYAGWMSQQEMYGCFSGADVIKGATSLMDALQFRKHYRGADGITVRYDPTQSAVQMDYKLPNLPYIGGNQATNYDAGISVWGRNNDPAQQDCCDPGDYCPVIIWRFDNTDAASTYSVRFEARVHVQGRPKGTCPFLSMAPSHDVLVDEVDNIVSNTDLFPVVVTGNSFKSFINRIGSIAKSGLSGLATVATDVIPHINRFLDMANRYTPKVLKGIETAAPIIASAAALL